MPHLSRHACLLVLAIAVCGAGVLGKFVVGQEASVRKSAAPVTPGHWKAPPQDSSILQSAKNSLSRVKRAFGSESTTANSKNKPRTVRYETWNPLKDLIPKRSKSTKSAVSGVKRAAQTLPPVPNSVTAASIIQSTNTIDTNQLRSAPASNRLDSSNSNEPSDIILVGANDLEFVSAPTGAFGAQMNQPMVAQVEWPKQLLQFLPQQQLGKADENAPAAIPKTPEKEGQFRIPLNDLPSKVEIKGSRDELSLHVNKAPIGEVLALIAQQHGISIVTPSDVDTLISLNLNRVKLEDALYAILTVNGYAWVRQKNILVVSKIDGKSTVSPMVQGRKFRVFTLNYVSATDVDLVVKGLLSPVGQSFATEATPGDKRRTQEQITVEDLPEYIDRAASYIKQVDLPPRQVLIEAHVMRIDLTDSTRHGVNFDALLQMADADLTIRTQGFANAASSPAFFLGIDGGDVDALLEAIRTTTSAKTLASPKVLAVNGQEARIQIGERLGYLTTTTLQTVTQQNVNFLETGVVLTVTPTISANGQILMSVMPKISSGRVNPDTGLPEEETTDVTSTVLLQSGQAMVIGGLITEQDVEIQSKIPILGDLWMVGRLFQRRSVVRERTEIVIALVPRVVPFDPDYQLVEDSNVYRATTPLVDRSLTPIDRHEPQLPDAYKQPRNIRVDRILKAARDLKSLYPKPLEYYFPSTSELWYLDLD
jgi:type II secretory pathway component GspD/PulD (secretin)